MSAAFGGAVRADVVRRAQPRHRGDVDDRSAVLTHPRPVRELHEPQRRHHVDVEGLADGVEVGVDERTELRVDPGVVDQDRESAERRDGGVDGVGPRGRIPGVARDGEHPGRVASGGACGQLGRRNRQLVRLAPGDRHGRTPGEELGGDRPADAPAAAGDQRRAVGQ
jgi:hypothetical protein